MVHRQNLPALPFLTVAFCLFVLLPAIAQNIGPNVLAVAAKAIYTTDNNIIVRWTPLNFKTWEWGRDSGYTLVRVTLADVDGTLSSEDQGNSIVLEIFTPKSQSQWEAAMLNDSAVGVAAGACFGEDFTVSGPVSEGIVTARNMESEKENRFGLSLFAADISSLAAKMQNLLYKDSTVQAGFRYAYIIRPGGITGNRQLKPGRVTITASEPYTPPPPLEFSVSVGDSVASLVWNQSAGAQHYSSYDVWRSKNNGPYEKVNTEPVLPASRPDGQDDKQMLFYTRLENNTDSFRFRVCGHTPFGFDGPLSGALAVKGIPAPLNATIKIGEVNELSSGMELHWLFPDSLNDKIQGFRVMRSVQQEGPFDTLHTGLLGVTVRQYTDAAPLPVNYYKLGFVDMNGNFVGSIPKLAQPKDSIAPEAPVSAAGEAVGTKGMLRIHWSPSSSPDVMGYRVFMADQPDGSYGQVTSRWVKDTVFYHIVNASSLSEQKYFKVKAVDFRENMSGFSPLCTVQLPDIVPPAVPVLKKTEPRQNGIALEFAPSHSQDVQRHKILRKKKDDAVWEEVAVLDTLAHQASVSFLDTTAEKMYTYAYMIQAEDDAGLKSNSKIFPAKNHGDGARAPVQQFEVNFVKSEAEIRLRWKYNNAYGVAGFVIYRGDSSANLYESGFVAPQQVIAGAQYDGPNPFAGATDISQVYNAGTAVVGGSLPAGSFDLQQTGKPNTTHIVDYEHAVKQFLTFKPYYYAVAVKYEDGSCSPLSEVKQVSAY